MKDTAGKLVCGQACGSAPDSPACPALETCEDPTASTGVCKCGENASCPAPYTCDGTDCAVECGEAGPCVAPATCGKDADGADACISPDP
jgi:hypothetical protein